jgi:glycosyltransferase involved in cell wall biosynthesis
LACGAPGLGTEIGAYQEIVRHGESGWLVPPRDSRALADAIRMLWNDADLRAKLSAGGRKRVLDTFNWRKAAEETLAVYEEVVGPRRKSFVSAGSSDTTS